MGLGLGGSEFWDYKMRVRPIRFVKARHGNSWLSFLELLLAFIYCLIIKDRDIQALLCIICISYQQVLSCFFY
jgi:hypothetical protein